MKERIMDVAIGILTCTSLAVTGLLVHREFFSTSRSDHHLVSIRDPNWRRYATGGIMIGNRAAPVTVVVFSDFQCPFCKQFSSSWEALHKKYPNDVRLVYHNFPLRNIHPYANDAALLAECANADGHFVEMERILFTAQDSIGAADWSWFARQAGMTSPDSAAKCVANQTFRQRIAEDEALGQMVPVEGTPTVFVNDRKLIGTPSYGVLDSLMRVGLSHR
jgi:protein-disulfide isomerase